MIDLHCHTTASDGSKTPTEFIKEAKRLGIRTVAITDHDTVDGIEEALSAGEEYGVRVIPGIELSAESELGNMHILGYHIDYRNKQLVSILDANKKSRQEKIPKVVAVLQAAGYDITLDEVLKEGKGVIGRPHVASVLVKKGYESSIKAAIDHGILADGGPADIKRPKLSAKECVSLIFEAGGVPVLAHPYQTQLPDKELTNLLGVLTSHGLLGIETYYSEHSPEMTKKYQDLADAHGLIKTGGSDWHGDIKPLIKLGTGKGNLLVPDECELAVDNARHRIEIDMS